MSHEIHPDHHPDERIQQAAYAEYARIYPIFLLFVAGATAAQIILFILSVGVCYCFLTRTWLVLLAFAPAAAAAVGSPGYFFFQYKQHNLFGCGVDERITCTRAQVKSKCYHICLYVYIFGALPMLFFDIPLVVLLITLGTWFVPTSIVVVRLALKGLYTPGTKIESADKYRQLRKNITVSALFFGIFMSVFGTLFIGSISDFDSIWHAIRHMLFQAVFAGVIWGVLFYFAMKGIEKISDRFANKKNGSGE